MGQKLSSDTVSTEALTSSLRSSKSWITLQNAPKFRQKGWDFITVEGCDHLRRGYALGIFSPGDPWWPLRAEDYWQHSYNWESFIPDRDSGQHLRASMEELKSMQCPGYPCLNKYISTWEMTGRNKEGTAYI